MAVLSFSETIAEVALPPRDVVLGKCVPENGIWTWLGKIAIANKSED
jgi:hypothetical protein